MSRFDMYAWLAIAVMAAACGSTNDDTAGPTDEEPDTTPPVLLSMSPEDGAVGLRADTVVTLRFSEAMDPSSVHGTLATADLGEVDLEWNSAGDTLTIRPREPLAYAEGDDPDEVEALRYQVVLGSAATDLEGNPLGPGATTTFGTLRRITVDVPPDESMSGSIHPDGFADFLADEFMVGDNHLDEGVRAVMTFQLGDLPAELVELESAHLAAELASEFGLPFDLGGAVLVDHVTYDGLTSEAQINAAFNASQAPLANLGPFANAESDQVLHDVKAAVVDDWEHRDLRHSRSQYLFRFAEFTDLDGEIDVITFHEHATALKLVYLTP